MPSVYLEILKLHALPVVSHIYICKSYDYKKK